MNFPLKYAYYSTKEWDDLRAHLPHNINFRQFKFFFNEGKMIKYPKQIRTFEQLKKALFKYEPDTVYISSWYALNPHKVAQKQKNFNRAGYVFSQNIILGSEFVIDIDNKDKDNLLLIVAVLKAYFGYENLKIYETKNGFHIWVLDFDEKVKQEHESSDPKVREFWNEKKRLNVLDKLIRDGAKVDFNVCKDTRRIVRLPYSHYNGEVIIKEITLNEVNKSARDSPKG